MKKVIFEYDARVDSKRRIIIKGFTKIRNYHVKHFKNGRVELTPVIYLLLNKLNKKQQKKILKEKPTLKRLKHV